MDIESLIYGYLSGTVSEDGEKELLEWIGQSEENRNEFYCMKALWNAGKVHGYGSDLAGFSSVMRNTDKLIARAERQERRRRLLKAAGAAAGIAAAILVAAMSIIHLRPEPVHADYLTYSSSSSDAVSTFKLEDGTSVWMKGGSRLTIPEAFGSTREVILEGEAYFDVAHDKDSPFMVRANGLTVQVLGTAFCVKSPASTDKVEVTLERGSVRLRTADGMNLATLRPDQRAYYDAKDRNLEISQTDASQMILMEYDLVTLSDATLFQIISLIETEYNVRLSGPIRDLDRKYTFNYLRSNTLEDILKIIEYLTGNRYEVAYTEHTSKRES